MRGVVVMFDPGRRPLAPHLVVSLVALASTLALALGLMLAGLAWLVAWLVAVTLVTFAAYGWDKHRARTASSRVPELTLHLLTLLGGTLGALAGRSRFRHKTRKQPFLAVFWAIVAVQVTLVVTYLILR